MRGFKLLFYLIVTDCQYVALRMECVDLSCPAICRRGGKPVALRMECVDLSLREMKYTSEEACRTPHGVRGFK